VSLYGAWVFDGRGADKPRKDENKKGNYNFIRNTRKVTISPLKYKVLQILEFKDYYLRRGRPHIRYGVPTKCQQVSVDNCQQNRTKPDTKDSGFRPFQLKSVEPYKKLKHEQPSVHWIQLNSLKIGKLVS
jgi:hypothetical protein